MFAIYICSFRSQLLSFSSFSFFSSFLCKTQTYTCLTFYRKASAIKANRLQAIVFRTRSFGPVEGGIRVVEEHPRELLIMGPFEMLRHGRTIGPPPSVTILPLPHDHRVSVLLPLGAHPPSPSRCRPASPRARPLSPVPSLWNFTRTRDTHSQRSGSVGTFSSFPTVTATVARSCLVVANLTNERRIDLLFSLSRHSRANTPFRSHDRRTKTHRRRDPGLLSREKRGRGERNTRTSTRT